MEIRARELFHAPPEKLNCAQAVLKAYQEVTEDCSFPLAAFKAFGGGRAPDGECGALFAACQCAPAASVQLREAFAQKTGSTLCKELLRARISCEDCVALGAQLLEKSLMHK